MPGPRTPLIYRPMQPARLRLWMPFDSGSNRPWLHETLGNRIQPVWNREIRRWEIARTHFTVLVDHLLDRFGEVEVTAEFSDTQRCDTRCREATGDDCNCSCLGDHHGGGLWGGGWIQVGETTLVRPGVTVRVMRLIA